MSPRDWSSSCAEPEGVLLEEDAEIFLGGLEAVAAKNFPRQAGVLTAGEFDAGDAVGNFEMRFKHLRESPDARAFRVDQRAVNIK